jgi:hypothetical protein
MEVSMELTVPPVEKHLVPIVIPAGIELTDGVVFVTPNGCRVAGLNLEQAYALLREYGFDFAGLATPRGSVS